MKRCRGLARPLVLALFASLVVLLRQRVCLAQPQAPREVEIVLVGVLGDDPVFASRVTSWFAPERFHVSVRRAAFLEPKQVLSPSADAFVHVWVTLSNKTLARLYFASASSSGVGGTSYFLRELRLENGLDEIGAEHVTEVLNLSTQAFVEGQAQSAREELEQTLKAESAPEPSVSPPSAAPAMTKARPASSAPPTDSAPGRKPRRSFGARVGYALSYRADEGTWHGPSAAFELTLWRKLGLRAAAQGALPGQRELEPLELRFYGVAFALAAGLRHALGAGIDVQWFGGPALDVVRYAPVRALSSDYAPGSAATEARPGLAAGVEALWGSWPVVALVAQATLPFTKTHYDVVQAETRKVIGRASAVVPTLGVEVGF
jgi:hypothetical protein